VDHWAEFRSARRVEKLGIKTIARRVGLAGNTVREAIRI
jgi:hypothetical protein